MKDFSVGALRSDLAAGLFEFGFKREPLLQRAPENGGQMRRDVGRDADLVVDELLRQIRRIAQPAGELLARPAFLCGKRADGTAGRSQNMTGHGVGSP